MLAVDANYNPGAIRSLSAGKLGSRFVNVISLFYAMQLQLRVQEIQFGYLRLSSKRSEEFQIEPHTIS